MDKTLFRFSKNEKPKNHYLPNMLLFIAYYPWLQMLNVAFKTMDVHPEIGSTYCPNLIRKLIYIYIFLYINKEENDIWFTLF